MKKVFLLLLCGALAFSACDKNNPERGARESDLTGETVDLSALLVNPFGEDVPHFAPEAVYRFKLSETKDCSILMEKLGPSLTGSRRGKLKVDVSSTDRAFGTLFGSEITRACGDSLPEDSYVIQCRGGGGQSFGAFIPKGLTLRLEGDSNDGFGKGLSGGKLVLYPPKASRFRADENIIVGNVALYGATSGRAFIAGVAGERFMTGGRVVILGATGKNFAAGMSGGIVYVLDEKHDLYTRLNKTGLVMSTLKELHDIQELESLIRQHVEATGSEKGKAILAHFEEFIPSFKKIIPRDYERMIAAIAALEGKGESREQAEIEAFTAAVRH